MCQTAKISFCNYPDKIDIIPYSQVNIQMMRDPIENIIVNRPYPRFLWLSCSIDNLPL